MRQHDDNDGYTDEEELADGSDPTDADSTPFIGAFDGFIVEGEVRVLTHCCC